MHHAKEEAEILIIQTVDEKPALNFTILVGEDTDLLVLLCHHASISGHDILFRSDKNKKSKVWSIKMLKQDIGSDICKHLPFIQS